MESLLRAWDGELTVMRFDPPTSAWIVIAIHSTRLGPAAGGTRMKPYPDLHAAIQDALILARTMTYKFAVADHPLSGGKAVIALPHRRRDGDPRHGGVGLVTHRRGRACPVGQADPPGDLPARGSGGDYDRSCCPSHCRRTTGCGMTACQERRRTWRSNNALGNSGHVTSLRMESSSVYTITASG